MSRFYIPDEVIELAKSKEIDEMLRTLGDVVRYRLTGEIVNKGLLELLDPNVRRSNSMKGKQNRLGTKNKSSPHLNLSAAHTKNKCSPDLNIVQPTLKSPSPKQPKPPVDDEALGIYISNNILLFNIVHDYIYSNIHYGNIQYLINTQGEKKYITGQMKEAEKIIKKIGMDNFKAILNFVHQDDFRSKQILSVAKLNRKNKEGVPYYIVMLDKIKQYTPKVYSIPTV